MAWFLKYYRHDKCGTRWKDQWSCACNDKCPTCGAEIEPYDWDDLSIVVKEDDVGSGWIVLVSSPIAEHTPDYIPSKFALKEEAEWFAEDEVVRLRY